METHIVFKGEDLDYVSENEKSAQEWCELYGIDFSSEKINITIDSGVYDVYIYGYEGDDWIKVNKIAGDMLMLRLYHYPDQKKPLVTNAVTV